MVVGIAAAFGILNLRVDTNHINFLSPRHPLGQSAAVIDTKLAGVYSYQIMLEGPPDSLTTPDALRRIDQLQNELRKAPYVRKATSIVDYVKRIHRELNDGRPDASVIPADANAIAQELLVFTLGGAGRHELERIAASDYSRAQISIKLQSMSSDLVLQHIEQTDARAREIFADSGIAITTTGSGRLFSTLDHYLVISQISSFSTAFVTVFAVIFIVFRSFRFGLLTIVPNVLPVVAVLGVMGYLGISMNIATVMLASLALGVVDDDTIHFINRYRREIARGATTDDAIGIATAHEGRASLTTAIVNSCGYGVLMLSEYKPTAWFGGLLALTMGVALLAEVLMLPATIKLLPRFFGADALRRRRNRALAAGVVVCVTLPAAASAQSLPAPTGYVSVFGDAFPNRNETIELRARIFAEQEVDLSSAVRVTASGFLEALVSRRPADDAPPGQDVRRNATVRDAVIRLHDANVDVRSGRVDVQAGLARVVWGKLDEIQPGDVINPLDVSRFFFEGRNEARLPVLLVRSKVFLSDAASVEGVYVPVFRRARFDQLDERSSPFRPVSRPEDGLVVCLAIGCPTLPPAVVDDRPAVRMRNAQGGARFSASTARVDWSISAYSGFEPFTLYQLAGTTAANRVLVRGTYPRFTVIGADFETVRGAWGIRGEAGAFVDDNFQSPTLAVVAGSSLDGGVGIDRKAGNYRISATGLYHREQYDQVSGGAVRRSDVSLVLSAEHSFSRERYQVRAFAVANPSEGSGFGRGIATAELRDNVDLEGSVGWFIGQGDDLIGRFAESDFVYVRLKCFF
jgi:MMPL family